MNSKSKLKKKLYNSKVCVKENKKSVRLVAFCLAAIMLLSAFSANVSYIVDLFTAYAADEDIYYSADLTLYDYYTDNEIINSGNDNNISDGTNRNKVFNTALVDSGYVDKAADDTHTWANQNLKYFPLYLGLQFPGGTNSNNFMRDDADNKYNYSITANSEANSTTSGAARGLIDDTLHNGVLTQGDCTVALPYFDEEFITAPLGNILSENSIEELGLSSLTSKTLGRVEDGYNFKFIKNSSGYYVYDSTSYGLNYENKTFTANPSGGTKYNDLMGGYGFFPWCYIDGSSKNFGYAAKFSIPFTMSTDGTIVNMDEAGDATSGSSPIEFNFRGDDDVWVFIDDKLVLDIGGAHGAVEGYINFATKTSKTAYVKTSTLYNQNNAATVGAGSEADLTQIFDELGLYDDVTEQHTLTVYYVERGSLESNCYISFNFQIADSISVENKLDTSDVNPYFTYETLDAAAREGVEYVIASNSATSTMDSPDIGKQNETLPVADKLCTLNFDSGGDYGSYSSYSVYVGTETILPSGYKLYRFGYHVKGWSLNPDGSGTVYTSYKATEEGAITFYAVWEKIPLAEVPEPLLFYVNSYGTVNSNYSLPNVTGNIYLANFTNNGNISGLWIQISGSQHPKNESSYVLVDNTGEGAKNGDTLNLKAGGAYAFIPKTTNSSELYKYTNYNASSFAQITNSSASAFVTAYFDLYNKLIEARDELLTVDDADLQIAYNAALSYYKTVQYSATATSSINDYVTEIDNALSALQYTHSYSYSAETTKVYIYSETDISGQSVTVTNASAYGLTPTAFSISKLSTVPSGATGTTGNYYVAEAPTYIIDSKTPSNGGATVTANIDPKLSFTVGGSTVTTTVSAVKSVDATYPCYYTTTGRWKGITSPDTYYSYSNNKIIWFYGNPGTVTYTSADGVDVQTVTAKKDIEGYYYIEVPHTVTKVDGATSTTGDVKLSFNLNGGTVSTTVSTAVSGRTAPCYFKNCNGISDGWYNLVTIATDITSYSTFYSWNSDGDVYPNDDYTWDNPCAMVTQTFTNQNSIKYYYLPYNSNILMQFNKVNSQTWSLKNGNYMYGDDSTWSDEITETGTWSRVYPLTATSKAATLLSSYVQTTSLQTFSMISNDITNDDATILASDKDVSSVDEPAGEENNVAAASTEESEALAVSGATQDEGQFTNDGTRYAYAKSTNFKLYDSYFSDVTGGERSFIVRQTSKEGNGEFNLLFNQKATFTYQFKRFSGIKIAQTGTSYKFDLTDDVLRNGNTVLADSSTKKYSDANSNKALYNRYSTTWVVEDEEGSAILSSRENYSVYPVAGDTITGNNEATIRNNSQNGSLYIDNIKEKADSNTGVHLTATFTNKVLVGDLTITKTLTQDALTAIQDYRREHTDYDPEFAFQVSFSNVFGGDSTEMVYQNVSTGVGEYYIKGTTVSSVYQTVNGLNGCIVMKYSDLYDDNGNAKNYSVVIKGIPVDTEFTVREVIVNEENTPDLQLQSVTQVILSDNTSLVPDANNAVSGTITSQKDENNGVDTVTDLQTGPLASYYPVLINSTDLSVQFVNDIENAYIILTKTIDELYYGANDNPAGLLGTEGTVGGATSTDNDPNGYEAATGAEQTFIFKISEYSSAAASTASKTFYEVISFPKGSELSKSKLIKVDPTKYYKVEEVSDWSWKYTFVGATVTKDGTNGNGVSNKIATVHNFGETAEFNGVTYTRTDTVTFTNNKKTDNTEDVEGDTSIMINIIGKAS